MTTTPAADTPTPWHGESLESALARLQTSGDGLADAEADARLARYGPNRLASAPTVSWAAILAAQLHGVVVWLLVAAGATSVFFGDYIEAIAIAVVLVIDVGIGFVTELRAKRAMTALLELDAPSAVVKRGGTLRTVDASRLVPGDIIAIKAGHHTPADARLLEAHDLTVDEAPLTGESLPVSKHAVTVPVETALAERADMVYKGTTVMSGTGVALVTATGAATEVGRIGTLVGGITAEPAPLERRLDELGRRLVWLTLVVAGVVAALAAFNGASLHEVIETGIALAVAAVPEALPAVATISLAIGMHRMAKRKALVRRLPAVEALGSATVVCTDKTRTLTSGRMTLVRLAAGTDVTQLEPEAATSLSPQIRAALEAAVYASTPQAGGSPSGQERTADPVDTAVLEAGSRLGLDRFTLVAARPFVALVPFSSTRQLMASFHRDASGIVAYVKGAPRQILSRCTRTFDGTPLDDGGRKAQLAVNDTLAQQGLRVLAVAHGTVTTADEAALQDLTFAGFLGFMDPPAPGVRDTIARLRAAGLRTIMLTGDQRLTAQAVGRDLGVLTGEGVILTGPELDALPPEALAAKVEEIGAYSRVSPEHKLTIVSALQARGHVVAMLGDGINDAAALRKADVGVAMGERGTDVAKEAASIVLQDDRFETVAAAVEEGRIVFDNIRKVVFYLFSCNLAEVLVLLAAGVSGLPTPLVPLQLLWLNIVTDTFPALALALEPGEPDVMRRPPRPPQEALLSASFLRSIAAHAAVITGATLAMFLWTLPAGVAEARTAAFMTLAFAQVLHLANARSDTPTLAWARLTANPYAIGAVVLSAALQVATATLGPLSLAMRLAPIDASRWQWIVAAALLPLAAGQLWRSARNGR
jgi:Ca2+-transporting ATPase